MTRNEQALMAEVRAAGGRVRLGYIAEQPGANPGAVLEAAQGLRNRGLLRSPTETVALDDMVEAVEPKLDVEPWAPARKALRTCHLAPWRLAPKFDMREDRQIVLDLRELCAACAWTGDVGVRNYAAALAMVGPGNNWQLGNAGESEVIIQQCHEAVAMAAQDDGWGIEGIARLVPPETEENQLREALRELRDAREQG